MSLTRLYRLIVMLVLMTISVDVACARTNGHVRSSEELNRLVVLRFYNAGLARLDYAAASKFFGERYIQHNPTAKDGPLGFKGFIDSYRHDHPHATVKIIHVIAEGNYVVLHVHAIPNPGDRGLAIIDMYRLKNHKIVEHWDVIQPVPEHSANSNGMFGPNSPNAGRSE